MTVLDLAVSIAAEIGGTVELSPEYELKDLKEKKIIVVPENLECEFSSRGSLQTIHTVAVGFFRRANESKAKDLLQEISREVKRFLGWKLRGAVCIGAYPDPLYDSDLLRSRKQFTSVIKLKFKEIEDYEGRN